MNWQPELSRGSGATPHYSHGNVLLSLLTFDFLILLRAPTCPEVWLQVGKNMSFGIEPLLSLFAFLLSSTILPNFQGWSFPVFT
jgi:hypothetical protein